MLSTKAYRVNPHVLVNAIKAELQNEDIVLPENHDLVKTGSGRQYGPNTSDWFYALMASIVRQAMCKGKVSLKGLSYRYGIRKNRGVRPSKFTRGSQHIIQSAINNLIEIKWFDFNQQDKILTSKANEILNRILENIK